MPRKLRLDLPDAFVRTVQEEGWAGFENGALLRRASGKFDVLLTADQRMRLRDDAYSLTTSTLPIRRPSERAVVARDRLRGAQALGGQAGGVDSRSG